MKQLLSALVLIALLFGCNSNQNQQVNNTQIEVIRVGIFDTNGDSPGCISDAFEALRIDAEISPEIIGAATIMSNAIMDYDLILFPGGSGKAQTIKLGQLGMQRVQDLVTKHGKSVLGICAGSYILSQTDGYPSLGLSGYQAIDIEHDHRGHGLVKFSLTEEGKKLFPELAGRPISFSKYYEGPVLTVADEANFKGVSIATMLSDVHTIDGTPTDMTNNRPFITTSKAGKGKVVTFVGHPENTPGMRWMIPRMVRWALGKELVSYGDVVIRPALYTEEILFTKDRLKQQGVYYDMLWGSSGEKVEAIENLVLTSSWSAKKKIIGLVRDADPKVRLSAAKAIVDLERTDALNDLEVAVSVEPNQAVKAEMKQLLIQLKGMVMCSQ